MSQPESRLSRQIMSAIRARGGFAAKMHGSASMMRGLPDISSVYRGYPVWLEVKMPHNRNGVEPAQKLRLRQLREAGAVVGVVTSVSEAMAILDRIDRVRDR